MLNSSNSTLPVLSAGFSVKGKFLYCGDEKFFIKGVTYGTFKPIGEGVHFPEPDMVEKDFAQMVKYGINAVRTYTVPPSYLLDIAEKYKIKIMAGLPWEQHITFLDTAATKKDIIKRVKESVKKSAGHPALLCYTIGNEIPAPIVRWYGKTKIENFLKQLYNAVKQVDKTVLVTYVNYPTTEYLDLDFLDFYCFNVYLETPEKLSKYLTRLHNLCGDRPLVLAEIGMDSMRNGTPKQAETMAWQIETVFAKGCAGMFVFAWTDEWWRGGADIEDWDFGLVDRQRNPKEALYAVSMAMANIPFPKDAEYPLISVIVCTYNGSPTIRKSLEGILKLDYPNYEVIVVNDGSTDNTPKIIKGYNVKLINQRNKGLSGARNTGMNNAKGEIIAYIDDDAYPDQHWLHYLAHAFQTSDHACIGGPNIAPYDSQFISSCVAIAPGGPVHVLETDEIAEHVPGCNMAFRKAALMAISGFDPLYRAAGDDVDVCWRIQQSGHTIGFHPSAVVWHLRRNSAKAYWKQQKGYGKAEALLELKWPEKYNSLGHLSWAGRIYGNGTTLPIKLKKDKIFHGVWGSAPFQSVYQQAPGWISYIPLMPEWYLLIFTLGFLTVLGVFWQPLLWLLPALILAQVILFVQAGISAAKSLRTKKNITRSQYFKLWGVTTYFHMLQPFARLYGRIVHGLSPWRKRGSQSYNLKLLFKGKLGMTQWSEKWKSSEDWLEEIEINLINARARLRRGGAYDNWDIQVGCGFFSSCRALLVIEEHGGGKQLVRFKCVPTYSVTGMVFITVLSLISASAILNASYIAGSILGFFAIALIFSYFTDKAMAMYDLSKAFSLLSEPELLKLPLKEIVEAEGLTTELIPVFKVKGKTSIINQYTPDEVMQK